MKLADQKVAIFLNQQIGSIYYQRIVSYLLTIKSFTTQKASPLVPPAWFEPDKLAQKFSILEHFEKTGNQAGVHSSAGFVSHDLHGLLGRQGIPVGAG